MIVLDASAAVDVLVGSARAARIALRLQNVRVQVPHLIDIELTHVLRRAAAAGAMTAQHAEAVLSAWQQTDIDRHPHAPYLLRVWQLRAALTAYDAMYVALAEALRAPLLTCDAKLARSHGHTAKIELV